MKRQRKKQTIKGPHLKVKTQFHSPSLSPEQRSSAKGAARSTFVSPQCSPAGNRPSHKHPRKISPRRLSEANLEKQLRRTTIEKLGKSKKKGSKIEANRLRKTSTIEEHIVEHERRDRKIRKRKERLLKLLKHVQNKQKELQSNVGQRKHTKKSSHLPRKSKTRLKPQSTFACSAETLGRIPSINFQTPNPLKTYSSTQQATRNQLLQSCVRRFFAKVHTNQLRDAKDLQTEKPAGWQQTEQRQREIEQALQAQMDWRVIQRQSLQQLRVKDLQDIQKMGSEIGVGTDKLSCLKEAVQRRYQQLECLFDADVGNVKKALNVGRLSSLNQQSTFTTQQKEALQLDDLAPPVYQITGADSLCDPFEANHLESDQSKEPSVGRLDDDLQMNTEQEAVLKLLDSIILMATHDVKSIKKSLRTPIAVDPLDMLSLIQGNRFEIEDSGSFVVGDDIYEVLQQERELCLKDCPNVQNFLRADRIHCRMVFDCINESFQNCRTQGLMPWASSNRQLRSEPDLQKALRKVSAQMEEWSGTLACKIPDTGMVLSNGELDDGLLAMMREAKLANVLALDVIDNDHLWVCYEFEEDQVRCDLGRSLFDLLLSEVMRIMVQGSLIKSLSGLIQRYSGAVSNIAAQSQNKPASAYQRPKRA